MTPLAKTEGDAVDSRLKRRFSKSLCLAWLAAVAPAAAEPAARPNDALATELDRLLGHLPQASAVCSAVVKDLATGAVLYELNADRPLIPASNAKLFALAAAIDELGSDFAFRTVVARRGRDLIIFGDGDPALGDPRLCEADGEPITAVFARWAAALAKTGRTTIEGDLIIDESIFDGQHYHPQWDRADLNKWYGAPVGALNFHDNCIDVTVWPAAEPGQPALWNVAPPTTIVKIVNQCKSGGRGNAVIARPDFTFEYKLNGNCSRRGTLQSVPVPDPGEFFASALQHALRANGVTVQGRIRRERVRTADGHVPADCDVVATQVTPLPIVTSRIGKNSQNLFAECLLKRLGYEWSKRQGQARPVGSWETGRSAVEAFLARAGASTEGLVISDASGLSRANRASAADFVRVLAYMHRRPGWEAFYDSLSVGGRDGSLRKRMTDISGSVHAKTGYVRGVRTLSGYVETRGGRLLCFSVLFNGIRGRTAPYNKIHDDVCRLLAAWEGQAPR